MDVNDEPPQFTNVPKPFLATVNPNAPAGILVYSLTAMDPDDGSNIRLEVDSQTSMCIFLSLHVIYLNEETCKW